MPDAVTHEDEERYGDAARAESVFREHGNAQRHSLFSRADQRNILFNSDTAGGCEKDR